MKRRRGVIMLHLLHFPHGVVIGTRDKLLKIKVCYYIYMTLDSSANGYRLLVYHNQYLNAG